MSRSRKPVNPSAQQGLDRLKIETAAELGLKDYQNTYKGALTSADNGRVGGHMVRKMIEAQEQKFGGSATTTTGQTLTAKYDANKQP
ncbi:MAG: alpha/beta-type small acid-soluble spore protein [Negativicutes bacterium]|nr:alpha/beta-type small acid-soluble spore protein [Negativicutes bacterium]